MLFNSVQFFVFFAVVLVLYYGLRHRLQNLLLLVSSYVFYGWWDWRFTALMLASTLIDFVAAIKIFESDDQRIRKRWVTLSITAHLLVLGFFKYFDFFTGSAETLANALGLPVRLMHLHLVLPVGLSFFASAWSEPALIKFAYAFEQATKARKPPTFIPSLKLQG